MTDKPLAPLSGAETEILRLLWQIGRGTVQNVCDRLPVDRQIAYATVQTMLRRLEAKGYVAHQTEGKAHVFQPAVARQDVVRRTVGDFVQRLFGGDPVPLMLHLADEAKLDKDDIQRLRELLDHEDTDPNGEGGHDDTTD